MKLILPFLKYQLKERDISRINLGPWLQDWHLTYESMAKLRCTQKHDILSTSYIPYSNSYQLNCHLWIWYFAIILPFIIDVEHPLIMVPSQIILVHNTRLLFIELSIRPFFKYLISFFFTFLLTNQFFNCLDLWKISKSNSKNSIQ